MSYCIDLSAAAQDRGGLGRYAGALARALVGQGVPLTAFVNDLSESRLQPPLSDLPTVEAGLRRKSWRVRAALSYFGGPALDRALPGIGLFHATEHLLPRLRHARCVFTLHDLAYLFPDYHLRRNRAYLRLMMPRFLSHADRIIAVSEATRRDALRVYDLDPSKIEVIPEGVEARFTPEVDASSVAEVRRRFALPESFILCISTLQPRKNLRTLLEAYAAVRSHHPDVGLVIAGARGWLYQGFLERIRSLGLEQHVHLTGYVPDEALPALLNASNVFAYPSEFEGFGLPPLEAMACGKPVLCSNASSLPEVVGDAGLMLPPHDVRAWVGALTRVLQDEHLRRDLRARGLARASLFSWDTAARRTLDVYRSVSRGPAARPGRPR